MSFPPHNKYHRRLLTRLHEKGAEFRGRLVSKASGVTPAGHKRQQREYRAGRALMNLCEHGLVRVIGRGKGKKRYTLTFEGWVYYATIVLEESDGQEEAHDHSGVGHTDEPTDAGRSVGR